MQALVWTQDHGLKLSTVEEPSGGPTSAVIQVGCTGFAETEVWRLARDGPPPGAAVIPGRQTAGTVVAVGDEVEGLETGTRVAVDPWAGCGSCEACRGAAPGPCPDRLVPGPGRPGALAERVVVPAAACHRLPPGLTFQAGTLAEPLARTIALKRLLADRCSRICLLGLSTLSLLAVQVLLADGGCEVMIVGESGSGLAAAAELGASHTVDGRHADLCDHIGAVWPQGPQQVVMTTPAAGPYAQTLGAAFRQARWVVAHAAAQDRLAYDRGQSDAGLLDQVELNEHMPADFAAALAALAAGGLEVDAWSTMRPLAAGPDSVRLLSARLEPVWRVGLTPAP